MPVPGSVRPSCSRDPGGRGPLTRALAAGALLASLCSCQPERAFVVIRLSGLSPQVSALEVRAVLDGAGMDATERFTDLKGPSASVSMWLPPGAAGPISVTAAELAGACTTSEGRGKSVIEGQPKVEIAVELAPTSPPRCEVTVERSGDGSGIVVADPQPDAAQGPPLSCGERCTFRAPLGSTVTLRARVQESSFLSKWSGCQTVSSIGLQCTVQVGASGSRIGVEFLGRPCDAGMFCEEGPVVLSGRTRKPSYVAVWAASPQELWVPSYDGTILRKRGAFWTEEIPANIPLNLTGVFGLSERYVWVVGYKAVTVSGVGLLWNGEKWTLMDMPSTAQVSAVWGDGQDRFFATARDGRMLLWDGSVWARGTQPGNVPNTQMSVDPVGIWGVPNGFAFTTGYGLYRSNGANSWIRIADVENMNHRSAIWGTSETDYWLLSSGSLSLRRTQGKLVPAGLPEETNATYRAIHGTSSSSAWAVSSASSIYHFDGAAWTARRKQTGPFLNGVFAVSGDEVYVVGDAGTLLHYRR